MTVKKIKAGFVNVDASTFVGEVGTLFYDHDTGILRISDGHTPGGKLIYSLQGQTNQPLYTTSSVQFANLGISGNLTSNIIHTPLIIGTGTNNELVVNANGYQWIFNPAGGLTFPDGTTMYSAGVGIGSGTGSTSTIRFTGTNSSLAIAEAGDVRINVNNGINSSQWRFVATPTQDVMEFPDGTLQYTAYTGTNNIFNQSLNTTDAVVFSNINVANTSTFNGNVLMRENLLVLGTINFVGTVTQFIVQANNGQFFGDLTGRQALYAGLPLGYNTLTNTVLQTSANLNTPTFNTFQNINGGSNATTEWTAIANNGNTTTNLIRFGITSTGWNGTEPNSLGSLLTANDGFLYTQGGDLVVGTKSANHITKIIAAGSTIVSISTLTVHITTGSITFPDGSVQTTAIPPLTVATPSALGGVKIGDNINITGDGVISIAAFPTTLSAFSNDVGYLTTQYVLNTATLLTLGGVKIGSGIQIAGDGTISVNTGTNFVLNTATFTTVGGVKLSAQNAGLWITSTGSMFTNIISTGSQGITIVDTPSTATIQGEVVNIISKQYILQAATTSTLGGIKVPAGSGIAIDPDGSLHFNIGFNASTGTRVDIIADGDVPPQVYISIDPSYVGGGTGNGSLIQSNVAPVTTSTSTLWYDTVGGRSYVYYDSSWVDASPATPHDVSVTVIAQTTSTRTITDQASAAYVLFTETVDTANAYANGIFTAPYTGYYQFNVSIYFSTSVTLNSGSFFIIDNSSDSTKSVTIMQDAWTGQYLHYSTVVQATAGDIIVCFVLRNASGANIDLASGCRLTIHRVSIS